MERTVKDVVPALQTNRDGVSPPSYVPVLYGGAQIVDDQIRKVIASLAEQYKSKEEDFDKFKQEYNIRPVAKV